MNTPTNDTRAQIIAHYSEAFSALVKVYDLAEGDIGCSEWFCNGYPFGGDLLEFIAEFGNYIGNLKGTNQ